MSEFAQYRKAIRSAREAQDLADYLRPGSISGGKKVRQTQSFIIAASRAILQEKPWEDVAVTEVTDAVGMVKSTLFGRFSSKRNLFEQVAHSFIDDIEASTLGVADNFQGELNEIGGRVTQEHNLVAGLYGSRCDSSELVDRLGSVVTNMITKYDSHTSSNAFLADMGRPLAEQMLCGEAYGVDFGWKVGGQMIGTILSRGGS